VLCSTLAVAADCPSQMPNEKSVLETEHRWAEALDKHDSAAIECILAEEFKDSDVDGHLHSREEALARVPQPRRGVNQLSDLDGHVLGLAGYVRGLNTVMGADGKPVAQVRFTDVFVHREGRWQAVSGQETLVKQESK
jgi:hypothetical protein